MLRGKMVVAQGGGPTAVINQSLVGAVLEARRYGNVASVYGARHGVRGIVNEDFVDLSREPEALLEAVGNTPASALGSTRDKPDDKYCRDIFRSLRAHGVSWFMYIGGNDSSDTVRIVSEEAHKQNYALRCVHIPKTIDNDLVENDHTPGFPSAARFVMQAFMGADEDNRALPGVYLAVVMGRHAGFLTAAAAAARVGKDDGPHLVYVPEREFVVDKFLGEVKSVYDRLGRCVIAVSEGIHDASGVPIIAQLAKTIEKDAHGNIQLSGTGALADLLTDTVRDKLGIKRVRADTFGYAQRSFAGVVSDVDRLEARTVAGRAVIHGVADDKDGSLTIRRKPGAAYAVDYVPAELSAIGGKTRIMPDAFLTAAGSDVTPAFFDYLTPLLGSDVPTRARLGAPDVAKLLKN